MHTEDLPNPCFFIAAYRVKPNGPRSEVAEHHTFRNRHEFQKKREELVAIYGEELVQAGRFTSEERPIDNPEAMH